MSAALDLAHEADWAPGTPRLQLGDPTVVVEILPDSTPEQTADLSVLIRESADHKYLPIREDSGGLNYATSDHTSGFAE